MGNGKDIANKAAGLALGITIATFYVVAVVGGLLLHLLTTFMLYTRFGMFWSVVGFFCPFLAEVFMLLRSWSEVGFMNGYTLLFFGVVIAGVLPQVIALVIEMVSAATGQE